MYVWPQSKSHRPEPDTRTTRNRLQYRQFVIAPIPFIGNVCCCRVIANEKNCHDQVVSPYSLGRQVLLLKGKVFLSARKAAPGPLAHEADIRASPPPALGPAESFDMLWRIVLPMPR